MTPSELLAPSRLWQEKGDLARAEAGYRNHIGGKKAKRRDLQPALGLKMTARASDTETR